MSRGTFSYVSARFGLYVLQPLIYHLGHAMRERVYASFLCYDFHVIRKLTTESESPDDFAHARDEFESMHFAHARSHIFA